MEKMVLGTVSLQKLTEDDLSVIASGLVNTGVRLVGGIAEAAIENDTDKANKCADELERVNRILAQITMLRK